MSNSDRSLTAGEVGGLLDPTPVDRDVLVHDLLQDETKAQVYTAVLVEGPVERQQVTDRIAGVGETTVYETLRALSNTDAVTVDDTTEPYEYSANPITTHICGDDGTPLFEVTPAFIAVVAARAVREDLDRFLDRHSIGTLATVYEATLTYLSGEATRRMAVAETDLDTYEGITVTETIESVVNEMRDADPVLAERLTDGSPRE